MFVKLSRRQQDILDFIKKEVREKGYPPSVREIGEAVNLSSSATVHRHLGRLEQMGYIRRDPTKPRAIEILEEDAQTVGPVTMAPVVGRVTAGLPITAVENIEDYFPLPASWTGGDPVFLLRVVGDSMIEAGIFDGDLVVVRQQPTAENGDIVVAMTDEGEATVKRFYQEKDRIRLQPENSTMAPLYYKNVTILGLVIGLYRSIR
ncbi:repressor LexA [Kyrpidia spormannii]|uniref:LexA repressor n=1 Tax=Kyrpidia spormannii TaxID=2055160 RepID=A0A2K8N8Y4_9BACL|nr:transcriptional repressor LexA [Kyrpidia spormannii]ATY84902.1 repressor LexA [Kyrpidia spormannii]